MTGISFNVCICLCVVLSPLVTADCNKAFVPEEGIFWYNTESNYIADTAVKAGDSRSYLDDGYGTDIVYVGGTWNNQNDYYAASIIAPATGRSFYAYEGEEYTSYNFDVMNIREGYRYEWVAAKNGSVPANAVHAGRNMTDKSNYFVGKMWYNGYQSVGNIVPKERVGIFSHIGDVFTETFYEVLVIYPDCCTQPTCVNDEE